MSARAVPFHCPYCGEETLFPHAVDDSPSHGTWECRSCLRVFKVNMIGQLRPPASAQRTSTANSSRTRTDR